MNENVVPFCCSSCHNSCVSVNFFKCIYFFHHPVKHKRVLTSQNRGAPVLCRPAGVYLSRRAVCSFLQILNPFMKSPCCDPVLDHAQSQALCKSSASHLWIFTVRLSFSEAVVFSAVLFERENLAGNPARLSLSACGSVLVPPGEEQETTVPAFSFAGLRP